MSIDELVHDAIRVLDQQSTWRLFELTVEPFREQTIEALLRTLDERGYIEVQLWNIDDPNPRPLENPKNLQPMRSRYISWYSPHRTRMCTNPLDPEGDEWGVILRKYVGDIAPEIRLTRSGKAHAARLRLDSGIVVTGLNAEVSRSVQGTATGTDTAGPASSAEPHPRTAPDALSDVRRRTRAQQQFTVVIDDLLARFENDGPYGADFFGPSPVAGELAAVLGFAAPPVEVMMIRRPESHPVFDKNGHVVTVGAVRFNDPNGLTNVLLTLHAFAEAAPDGSIAPQVADLPPDLRAVARARSILESWLRNVKALDVQSVMHTSVHLPSRDNSLAIMAYKWRLGREIAGLGDLSRDEEMFWHQKHDDAMKKGLGRVEIKGSGLQLVAKVDPKAGRGGVSALDANRIKSDSSYIFRRTGTMWEVRFGQERGHFRDKRGYRIIATLLRQPDPTRPPTAISLGGYDERADTEDRTFQATLDSEGKAKIQNRIEDLKELLIQAERNCDAGADQYRAELDQLSALWAEAHGLGGRDRDLSKSVQKNAQSNVGQRVKDAINEIGKPMPKLAEHLRAAISTGVECAYRPAINISWELD